MSAKFRHKAAVASRMRARGMNPDEIAKKMRVSKHAVYQYLRAGGGLVQKQKRKYTKEKLRKAVKKGRRTYEGAAEHMGCSVGTARALAREAGISLQRRNSIRQRRTTIARAFFTAGTIEETCRLTGMGPRVVRESLSVLGLIDDRSFAIAKRQRLVRRLRRHTNLSLYDIARGVGTNTMTVSRDLKQEPRISADDDRPILSLIEGVDLEGESDGAA